MLTVLLRPLRICIQKQASYGIHRYPDSSRRPDRYRGVGRRREIGSGGVSHAPPPAFISKLPPIAPQTHTRYRRHACKSDGSKVARRSRYFGVFLPLLILASLPLLLSCCDRFRVSSL